MGVVVNAVGGESGESARVGRGVRVVGACADGINGGYEGVRRWWRS